VIKSENKNRYCEYVSYALAAALLLLTFPLRLMSCLLAGMIAYEIITSLSRHISRLVRTRIASWIAVFLISLLVVASLVLLVAGAWNVLTRDFANEYDLYAKTNSMLQEAQRTLSPVLGDYLPQSYNDIQNDFFMWLQRNVTVIQALGQRAVHFMAMVFVGLVLAVVVSLSQGGEHAASAPLSYHLQQRVRRFRAAFRNVVLAQIKVAAVNTLLTAFFLYAVMPLLGHHLPYAKSVIIITFLCGLLPIIGNLISNIIIVTIALSVSLGAGGVAMGFLIFVHKLEYFINARIFGSRIESQTWELLLVMLLFEAAFGLAGVVAAPIYYAYLKAELKALKVL